ncbi:unnamed protein product [Closterium sp. NIES-65]|nr:unnamed protein product [Closterium sp. NIES-65]
MFNRFNLDRFKKAQSSDPFGIGETRGAIPEKSSVASQTTAVAAGRATGTVIYASSTQPIRSPVTKSQEHAAQTHANQQQQQQQKQQQQQQPQQQQEQEQVVAITIGGGSSTWQPPEWAVVPKPGVYSLEVLKDGVSAGSIPLDKKRSLFGRQTTTCDYVLEHPSLSRQHAAVVHRKNGSVFVIDLGSVHGTYVSNERLLKDIPVEIEPGQSLRFAASTRTYVLRKTIPQPPPPSPLPSAAAATDLASSDEAHFAATAAVTAWPGVREHQQEQQQLPPPPDKGDPEAVAQYNMVLNLLGLPAGDYNLGNTGAGPSRRAVERERKRKREEGGGEEGGEVEAAAEGGKGGDERGADKAGEGRNGKANDEEPTGKKHKVGAPSTAAAGGSSKPHAALSTSEAASRARRARVKFRDEQGGLLVEVVGFSDGAHVGAEPGPVGVKEGGSLMGRFDSLVQTVVIPRVRTKNTAAGGGSPGSTSASMSASTSAAAQSSQSGLSVAASPSPALQAVSSPTPSARPSPSVASPSSKVSVADRMKWYMERVKSPKQQGLYGGLGEENVLVKRSESWAEARDNGAGMNSGAGSGGASGAASARQEKGDVSSAAEDDSRDLFHAAQ